MSNIDDDFSGPFRELSGAYARLDTDLAEIWIDPSNANLYDHADSSISAMESAIRRLKQLLQQNRPASV